DPEAVERVLRQQGLMIDPAQQGLLIVLRQQETNDSGPATARTAERPVNARTEDWIRRQQGWLEVLSAQGLKTGSRGSKDGWRSCQRKD
ncbi:hypothetical protein ACLKA7_005500, partial [Drosophila subpalustris]